MSKLPHHAVEYEPSMARNGIGRPLCSQPPISAPVPVGDEACPGLTVASMLHIGKKSARPGRSHTGSGGGGGVGGGGVGGGVGSKPGSWQMSCVLQQLTPCRRSVAAQ